MSAAPGAPPPRRPYRSARRRLQAAETRDAVLAAAGLLFATRGWTGTAMRDVAAAAGVSVETVYAHARSKADLLGAAIDVAVVGDTAEVPLRDRPEFAALGEGDVAARTAAAARLVRVVNERTAALHRTLVHAAAADRSLADRVRTAEDRRRTTVTQAAELVAGRPVTADERDGLWAVVGVEVWFLLTELSGWTPGRYEAWVADTARRLLDLPSPAR